MNILYIIHCRWLLPEVIRQYFINLFGPYVSFDTSVVAVINVNHIADHHRTIYFNHFICINLQNFITVGSKCLCCQIDDDYSTVYISSIKIIVLENIEFDVFHPRVHRKCDFFDGDYLGIHQETG